MTFFTSESVTEGHPDKMADQISDAILDEMLRQDPNSRVAVECLLTTGLVIIAGEVTTKANVNVQHIARRTIKRIGYDRPEYGFDFDHCSVLVSLHEQSKDIAIGVNEAIDKEQGAGDQGLMFGYATNETAELMPLPISLAHKLTAKLAEVRKENRQRWYKDKKCPNWMRPDGKAQVTVEYVDGKPTRVHTVVVSTQHSPEMSQSMVADDVMKHIINPVCGEWTDEDTIYHINPTGRFVIGGPPGDTGLTGRKIIVDTYGGVGAHGGGCFSGKCCSKVDRSAAYMARHIAKNIVAAGLADKCEIQIAYAIGVAHPVSVMIDTKGTGKISDKKILEIVNKVFDLRPREIIEYLKLKRPIYEQTAAYGHFGRELPEFTWEHLTKVPEIKRLSGLY